VCSSPPPPVALKRRGLSRDFLSRPEETRTKVAVSIPHLTLGPNADAAVFQPRQHRGSEHLRSRPTASPQPVLPHPTRAGRAATTVSTLFFPAVFSALFIPPGRHRRRGHSAQVLGALAAPRVWPDDLRCDGNPCHCLTRVVLCPAGGWTFSRLFFLAGTLREGLRAVVDFDREKDRRVGFSSFLADKTTFRLLPTFRRCLS